MEDGSKYKQDVADPDVNIDKLNEIFEVDTGTGEMIPIDDDKKEIALMRESIKEIENDMPDIDGIILDNISRANRFLDKIEDSVMNGNGSAVMMESTATLINAVNENRIDTDAVIMLNITGGGEERFKDDNVLFYLKPLLVFDIDPDPEDVKSQIEKLF